MDRKKGDYSKALIMIGCALAIWLGSGTDAAKRTYELHPEIGMATPQTNTVMVLDAYERLMDNYMSLVQSNLNAMSGDMTQATKQLGSIDRKLDNLAVRMAQIERALNLPPGPVPGNPSGNRLY
jgi:hypothetical protein